MCKIGHLALIYLITHSFVAGRWFSPGTLGTKNKTDRRDIAEIVKVALDAMTMKL
jgi:Holliday junction resolvase RusA-like endonuclease